MFRNLVFLLTLVVGSSVFAQQPTRLTLPERPEDSARYLIIGVGTAEGVEAGHAYDLEYDVSQGPFLPAIQAKIAGLILSPPQGYEDADFFVFLTASADLGTPDRSSRFGIVTTGQSKAFRFEKVGGEWKLPQTAFDLRLTYPGMFFFYRPSVTAFEIRAKNSAGREEVFSTKTMVNTFTNLVGCNLPSATNALAVGLVQLLREFVVSTDPNRWWSEQEITVWEESLSSSASPASAPRLAMRQIEKGFLELSVLDFSGYLSPHIF